jgi:hypothetical protein
LILDLSPLVLGCWLQSRRWAVLRELSVAEQRYQAVLAVIEDGVPITEVAAKAGVSRQALHSWLSRSVCQRWPGGVDGPVASAAVVSASDGSGREGVNRPGESGHSSP